MHDSTSLPIVKLTAHDAIFSLLTLYQEENSEKRTRLFKFAGPRKNNQPTRRLFEKGYKRFEYVNFRQPLSRPVW